MAAFFFLIYVELPSYRSLCRVSGYYRNNESININLLCALQLELQSVHAFRLISRDVITFRHVFTFGSVLFRLLHVMIRNNLWGIKLCTCLWFVCWFVFVINMTPICHVLCAFARLHIPKLWSAAFKAKRVPVYCWCHARPAFPAACDMFFNLACSQEHTVLLLLRLVGSFQLLSRICGVSTQC